MNLFSLILKCEAMLFDLESNLKKEVDISELAKFLYEHGIEDISSVDELISCMKRLNYNAYGSPIEEIVIFEKSLVPKGTVLEVTLRKRRYKVKGNIWIIHKNDSDPFPSIPHAHNYDENLVLHLGSGELFNNRRPVSKANKKHFGYRHNAGLFDPVMRVLLYLSLMNRGFRRSLVLKGVPA